MQVPDQTDKAQYSADNTFSNDCTPSGLHRNASNSHYGTWAQHHRASIRIMANFSTNVIKLLANPQNRGSTVSLKGLSGPQLQQN